MSVVADALARPALTVDGRDYAVSDVAAAALYLGEWSGVRARASAGEALTAGTDPVVPPAEEVARAAELFRRERRLLAAEEMEEWLARRAFSAGEWMRWVRMDVARRSAPATTTVPDTALPAVTLYAEAICSGALSRAGRWLAEILVAPRPTGGPATGRLPDPKPLAEVGIDPVSVRPLLEELRARRSAVQELADTLAEGDGVAAQVRARQADWLTIRYRVLAVADESAAREALLCVRDDGMGLAEVAALAGTDLVHEHTLLADIDPDLQPHLLSASSGELIGPVERGDGAAIVQLEEKAPPSEDDPEVIRRARRELLMRTLEREVARRVVWHDRL